MADNYVIHTIRVPKMCSPLELVARVYTSLHMLLTASIPMVDSLGTTWKQVIRMWPPKVGNTFVGCRYDTVTYAVRNKQCFVTPFQFVFHLSHPFKPWIPNSTLRIPAQMLRGGILAARCRREGYEKNTNIHWFASRRGCLHSF